MWSLTVNKNKIRKFLVVILSVLLILAVLYLLTSFFDSTTQNDKTNRLDNKEYRTSAQREANELCAQHLYELSMDCKKTALNDVSWAYYDQAKGEIGQYSYSIGNYKIIIFLRVNGEVDNSYIENPSGTTIYEHTSAN